MKAVVYSLVMLFGMICSSGCVSGTVSTAFYKDSPQPPMFYVIQPDSLSLTDRHISNLIEAKMNERGYTKATSIEAANIGVLFKYSIDPSGSVVGDGVNVETVYPRHFHIFVIDLHKSKPPEKLDLIWQGEVYSAGTSRNISRVAPIFVEQLFLNYGQTVTNKGFSH
jgi:hypothetical protein